MSWSRRARKVAQKFTLGLKFGLADELGWLRWRLGTQGGRRPPVYQRSQTTSGLLNYSQAQFYKYRPFERTRWPLFLLAAIPGRRASDLGAAFEGNLLIIGPRFENELFLAEALGWTAKTIFALDLLSYSPRVSEGDMHEMPFSDEFFRSIVCGWTLSYSTTPDLAAREIDRVCAPGGFVCFGVDVVADKDLAADVIMGERRIQSVEAFRELLPRYSVIAQFAPEGPGPLVIAMQKPLHSERFAS